jgi:outer membrane lipoprotein-sorting protein
MSQLKWLLFASVLTVAFVLACGSADEATPVPATATSPPAAAAATAHYQTVVM